MHGEREGKPLHCKRDSGGWKRQIIPMKQIPNNYIPNLQNLQIQNIACSVNQLID